MRIIYQTLKTVCPYVQLCLLSSVTQELCGAVRSEAEPSQLSGQLKLPLACARLTFLQSLFKNSDELLLSHNFSFSYVT